jgi:hypothetical protein
MVGHIRSSSTNKAGKLLSDVNSVIVILYPKQTNTQTNKQTNKINHIFDDCQCDHKTSPPESLVMKEYIH